MKRALLLAAMALPTVALAQAPAPAPIVATPLLPPSMVTPTVPPTPTDQTQVAPQLAPAPQAQGQGTQGQATQGQGTQGQAQYTAPAAPQPIQLTWVPQGAAQLQVLDKVNALNKVLTVKVGDEGQYGSLTIQVKACDTHPSNQPQDSAAYLTITDGHADAPGFQGWMLANDPSVSMLQNPIYDVRVVGCQA